MYCVGVYNDDDYTVGRCSQMLVLPLHACARTQAFFNTTHMEHHLSVDS